jgi:glycosyltransferase involved in cell wall biosynthesis
MKNKPRLLRITTVPISLKLLLNGQLSFFQNLGYEVLTVSADGPETEALREENIPHRVVAMTRKITPVRDVLSLLQLVQVILKFKPMIVHTHTPKAGLLGMMAAWLCRVPVRLHTVAGLPLMESGGMKKKLLVVAERLTYFFSTEVYVNSTGLKNYIAENVSASKKISIVGKGSSNGINADFYSRSEALEQQAQMLRVKYGIGSDDIVFSFVGRVVKDKGIGEIVFAFKKLVTENTGRRFFLLLVGPFEQDLDPLDESDYAYLSKNDKVILAGFQRDVRPWIMASDVFVFPSYREGFPNVVMQACCLGVPTIVSDINGCNEIVKHNETGTIVKPKDKESLKNAMNELISDRRRMLKYSQNARQFVIDNFDQQHIWRLLQKEYEKHLSAH